MRTSEQFRAISVTCFTGLIALFLTSCSSVTVTSIPPKANVFINGKDTGLRTPAEFHVHSLPTGILDIEARLQGYNPASKSLRVGRSTGKIIFSIWPPALIDFACDGWKTARPGSVALNLTSVCDPAGQMPFTAPAAAHAPIKTYGAENFPITDYHFDSTTGKGSVTVDIGSQGFQARLWVIKNIGMICASKNVALEAGSESFSGAKYKISDESIREGLLTIGFEATY